MLADLAAPGQVLPGCRQVAELPVEAGPADVHVRASRAARGRRGARRGRAPARRCAIAARRRPWAIWMSASAIEQPRTSETWSICSNSARQAAYDAWATSRSPVDHAASPRRADAAPRARWSSSTATSSAEQGVLHRRRRRLPASRASPARWKAIWAGSRRNSSWFTTTIGLAPCPGPRGRPASARRHRAAPRPRRRCRSTSARRPGSCRGPAGPGAPRRGGLQPAAQRRLAPVPPQGGDLQLHQVGGPRRGRRRPSRAGSPRRGRRAAAYQLAGPSVQVAEAIRLLVEEPGLEDVGEEVVVAVPLAAVVQRDQEEVVPVEGLEQGPAAGLAGDRVAQGAGHPVEDRGLQQERLDVLGLALQHLLDEVVDDVPVIAREARDEGRRRRPARSSTGPRAGVRRSSPRCAPPVPPRRRR